MSDTIKDAIESLADKSVDELFAFFEGQGITNSYLLMKRAGRITTCPVAQYLSKVTGKIIVVHSDVASYNNCSSPEVYTLPTNVREFITKADREIQKESRQDFYETALKSQILPEVVLSEMRLKLMQLNNTERISN